MPMKACAQISPSREPPDCGMIDRMTRKVVYVVLHPISGRVFFLPGFLCPWEEAPFGKPDRHIAHTLQTLQPQKP